MTHCEDPTYAGQHVTERRLDFIMLLAEFEHTIPLSVTMRPRFRLHTTIFLISILRDKQYSSYAEQLQQ